jgi:hypothetical protein
MRNSLKKDILRTQVNSIVGMIFLGSAALLAIICILEITFSENPFATIFARYSLLEVQITLTDI